MTKRIRFEWALKAVVIQVCLLSFTLMAEDQETSPKLRIFLDPENPGSSYGVLVKQGDDSSFRVGLGRKGVLPAGRTFKGGYSLLGRFRVTAILTATRFEMEPGLIQSSRKTGDWLKQHLFKNMSSIDFDGDGKGGEYGSGFIGLHPMNSHAKQPFHFGTYKGVFRWYSFAIHGTQDESRVGKCATGGCINVKKDDLEMILRQLNTGDQIEIVRLHSK